MRPNLLLLTPKGHGFRYYSQQWRTWSACFIQAAWRKHQKRKATRELSIKEGLYYVGDPEIEGSSGNVKNFNNLGATVLASKFAANTRRANNKIQDINPVPQLFKPDEPDFSLDHDDV